MCQIFQQAVCMTHVLIKIVMQQQQRSYLSYCIKTFKLTIYFQMNIHFINGKFGVYDTTITVN